MNKPMNSATKSIYIAPAPNERCPSSWCLKGSEQEIRPCGPINTEEKTYNQSKRWIVIRKDWRGKVAL
jgi:hypothetical protein